VVDLLIILLADRATQKKLALDSMYKLEHGVDDQSRGKSSAPTIAQVVELQAAHKDDFLLNQLARKQFRVRLCLLVLYLYLCLPFITIVLITYSATCDGSDLVLCTVECALRANHVFTCFSIVRCN